MTAERTSAVKEEGAKEEDREVVKDMKEAFNEFCDASTIHGLKYLGTRPFSEKLLWLTIFIVSLTSCGFQIKAIYDKWVNVPIVVTFNENLISIADIPFPAVTICHQVKAERERFDYDAFYDLVINGSLKVLDDDEDRQTFEAISQMCFKDNSRRDVLKMAQKLGKGADFSMTDIMNMAPPFDKTFRQCGVCMSPEFWNCRDVFSEVLIEDGFCYSFNLLNREELLQDKTTLQVEDRENYTHITWPNELGGTVLYDNDELDELDLNFREDPLRAYTTSQKLQIQLRSNKADLSKHCQGTGERFRVYLHSPYELPSFSTVHQSYDVDVTQSVTLSVVPRLLLASDSLRTAYSPSTRRCYFNDERVLRYFKTYTKKNCEVECLSNITRKTCNCVPFWLPREPNTPICSLKKYLCVQITSYYHLNLEMATTTINPIDLIDTSSSTKMNRSQEFKRQLFGCNCLSACKSIHYEANVREIRLVERNSYNQTGLEGAKIIVQFSEPEFFALKRTELYGMTDFIANCGGLLGLFMGVSLLSFVEVIYFFSIRFITRIKWLVRIYRT